MSGHQSDALGIAGEDAFRSLCSRAKLIVTKADVDRCGWDFRVEWRDTSKRKMSDQSPPRLAALVQVKSVFVGANRVAIRLGAANDLVRSLEPSFFVVLVFSKDLELLEVRGASTFGPIACEILKSIRRFVASGSDARNRTKQLALAKWTDPIRDTPDKFASYFTEHIGTDLRSYSTSKHEFLESSGFEEAPLTLNAKLFGTPEEIADAFLGDRSVSGELLSAFQERFKIALPVDGFKPMTGSFSFAPEPSAGVRATLRDRSTRRQFRFEGDEYQLPAIVMEHLGKLKFDFLYFSLYVVRDPERTAIISFSANAKKIRSISDTIAGWLNFYSFLDALSSHRLDIAIRRIGSPGDGLTGELGPDPTFGTPQIKRALGVLKLLDAIYRDCGIAALKFSPNDISCMEHTLDCLAQSFGRAGPPYLNLSVDTIDPPLVSGRVVLLLTFHVFSQFLTLIVRAECVEHTARGQRDEFALRNVEYLKAELTDTFDEADAIGSEFADDSEDEYVLMLPQGDVGHHANGKPL